MKVFLVLAIFLMTSPASASVLDQLKRGPQLKVIEVVDGDTVVLDQAIEGATEVRLVGLQAPKLPLGRKGFKMWPLAPASKSALEALTLNKRVTLAFGGRERDRHGRLLAHLFLEDGSWVQGQMLLIGMARVYTFPDNRSVVSEMHKQERAARDAKRGIWAHPFYAVRPATPEALVRLIGTFQVIEGKILAAARVKSRVYLNFGEDWRSDFTATLNSKSRKLFKKFGVDPLQFQGRTVRVRGWLKKYNGPSLTISHPEQIEVVEQ
jgi:micrococcal nuclease